MPEVYISQIDFGDGVVRTIKDPNASGGGGSMEYLEDDFTLSADDVTQCAFYSSKIKTTSAIQVFNNEGSSLFYESLEILDGSVIITFPPQSEAKTISVRIYII